MKKNHFIFVFALLLIWGCKKSTPVCLPCYYMDHFIGVQSQTGDSMFALSTPPRKSPYTDCYDSNTYTQTGPLNLPLGYLAQLSSDTLYVVNGPTPLSDHPKPTSANTLYCR